MATWINLRKVAKFPEVVKVYTKAGRGQGNTTNSSQTGGSAARGFLMTVKRFVNESSGAALPAWIKKDPGTAPSDWQNVKIDVTAIPGVRPLRDNGKWVS